MKTKKRFWADMTSSVRCGFMFGVMMLSIIASTLVMISGWLVGSPVLGALGTVVGMFFACISVFIIGNYILDMD